jgi:hypothetical protein
MLNLLCVNSSPVTHQNGIISEGSNLVEGTIYTADDRFYIHPNNKNLCYLILELNDLKLVSRFIPISNIDETEPVDVEVIEKGRDLVITR